jgi:hypothetical protein
VLIAVYLASSHIANIKNYIDCITRLYSSSLLAAIVFVYDFHAGAETLMHRHFTQQGRINGFNAPFMGLDQRSSRQFPKGKMGKYL